MILMRNSNHILFISAFLMIAAVLSSCSADTLELDPSGEGRTIHFSSAMEKYEVSVDTRTDIAPMEVAAGDTTVYLFLSEKEMAPHVSSPATKGSPVDEMYGSMYVTAYKNGGDTPYFTNYLFNESGGDWTRSGGVQPRWSLKDDSWRFFAVAPSQPTILSTTGSSIVYSYEPSTTVSSQVDLVEAVSAEYPGDHNGSVPLNFNHVLSGIQFVVGDNLTAMTLNNVKISGIYMKGRHEMGSTTWDVATDNIKGDYVVGCSKVTDGTSGDVLLDGQNTFLVIPQTCPSGAKIEFRFSAQNEGAFTTYENYVATADISGMELVMGKTYVISMSLDPSGWYSEFKVVMPSDWTYEGGTRTLEVKSTRIHALGISQYLPWTAEFSEESESGPWRDTAPSWISGFPTTSDGTQSYSITASSLIATLGALIRPEWPSSGSHSVYRGSAAAPVDLSKEDVFGNTNAGGLMTTANTYVIHSPGMYMIPLVYGNAITDGATNVNSYSTTGLPSAGNSYCVDVFHNAYDTGISSPYIESDLAANSHTLGNAILVWEEVEDLISVNSTLETHDGIKYLVFEVPAATIAYSNAIVGVRDDSDNIVWSWQLWFTAEEMEDIHTTYGAGVTLLSKNIGQLPLCIDYKSYAPERTFWVRFTQAKTGIQTVKKFTSTVYENGRIDYYPSSLYRLGRKDPFPSSWGNSSLGSRESVTYGDMPFRIDNNGNGSTRFSTGTIIMNPNVYFKFNGARWFSDNPYHFNNIWNMQNYAEAFDCVTVKTVYDPSPAGYCVPRHNTWQGFSINSSYIIDYNGDGSVNYTDFSDGNGWYFKRSPSDSEGYFIPNTARLRDASGSLVNLTTGLWLASPGYYAGYTMYYINANINPQYDSSSNITFNIRPQKIESL